MADEKITELASVAPVALGDLLPLVDVSDTSMGSGGTDKQATVQNLLKVTHEAPLNPEWPEYGADPAAADNTTAFTAAIGALPAAGGSIRFGPGIFNGLLNLPQVKRVDLSGAGMDSSGGVYGTKILRPLGSTAPVLNAIGAPGSRCYFGLRDLVLDGGGANGDVFYAPHTTDVLIDRVRVKNGAQKGFHALEMWNADIKALYVSNCGSGATHPAMLLEAAGGAGTESHTVLIGLLQLEGNTGIDLQLDGDQPNGAPCIAVNIALLKIERANPGQSYPAVKAAYVRDSSISGGYIYLGHGTSRHIEMNVQNGCDLKLDNLDLRTGGSWAADYFVEHVNNGGSGSIDYGNVGFDGSPSDHYIHVGSGVGLNDVGVRGNLRFSDTSKRFKDDRPKAKLGRQTRQLMLMYSSPVYSTISGEVGTSQLARYSAADATFTILSTNFEVPPDALANRPVEFHIWWSTSGYSSGNSARFAGVTQRRVVGDSSTIAGTNISAVDTDPGGNNKTAKTVLTGPTADPGDLVQARLWRDGSADSLNAGLEIEHVELVYEVA